MIRGGMVFCEIIHKIVSSWFTKYVEMTLFGTVYYSVKMHANCSWSSLSDCTVQYYAFYRVFGCKWGCCFWVSYLRKLFCK